MCVFGNGDDNIAIKAGRDLEARTLGRPSRNIVVRNCIFSGYNAIAVGSEMSGGVHDVYVEDCSYAGKVIYGFYLKGNRDRGGAVHDIYARNITLTPPVRPSSSIRITKTRAPVVPRYSKIFSSKTSAPITPAITESS